jgi:monofunctional biosynthetic peptidoglycan transglycosylase
MTDQEPPKRAFPLWKILLWSPLVLVIISILLVLPWRWLPPPTTAFMLIYQWQTDEAPVHGWVYWDDINPYMAIAVVAAEDQKFPDHYGFDLDAIKQALNERRNRPRGASTISQQVAKNLYLWNGRSYVRKGIEAWFTLLIETFWSKQRILEVYLNIAEFGPGIYGVGAASIMLDRNSPAELTEYDCALLAAVLPNPKEMSATNPSAYVRGRASTIQRQVRRLGGTSYLRL